MFNLRKPVLSVLGTLLLMSFLSTCVRAQLRITRQVLGTTTVSSTPSDPRFLKFTASTGEVLIGSVSGDVRATLGFQQPDDDVLVSVITVGNEAFTVTAYPNPVVAKLFVDLGKAASALTEVRLINANGQQVAVRKATLPLPPLLTFHEAAGLPAGPYFLSGTDRSGQLHFLGRILIVSQ